MRPCRHLGTSYTAADRVAIKSYFMFHRYKSTAVLWFVIQWKLESEILSYFKANFNALIQIKLSEIISGHDRRRKLFSIFAPVEREFCLPQTKIQTKFTYSGIVLAAEATLSLDSFFFIALEAIFAWISRIFEDKSWSLSMIAKLCCHVNRWDSIQFSTARWSVSALYWNTKKLFTCWRLTSRKP